MARHFDLNPYLNADPKRLVRGLHRISSKCWWVADRESDNPLLASKMLLMSRWLRAIVYLMLHGAEAEIERFDRVVLAILPDPAGTFSLLVIEYARQLREAKARGAPPPERSPEVRRELARAKWAPMDFDAYRKPKRGGKGGDVNRLSKIVQSQIIRDQETGRPLREIVRTALEGALSARGLEAAPDTEQKLVAQFSDDPAAVRAKLARAIFRACGWKHELFRAKDMASTRARAQKKAKKP